MGSRKYVPTLLRCDPDITTRCGFALNPVVIAGDTLTEASLVTLPADIMGFTVAIMTVAMVLLSGGVVVCGCQTRNF
eukprot:1191017-Prorocentrum_minimum.AAC.7